MERAFFLCTLMVLAPRLGAAQADPDSVKHRNECRLAEQVLTTGTPAPHHEWAEGYIPSCGFEVWGRTAAIAVRRTRDSNDLEMLSRLWRRLNYLHDSAVLQAALDIAADGSASDGARVFAIRYLLTLIDPNGNYQYGALTESGDEPGARPRCTIGEWAGTIVRYDGTPLPAGYRNTISLLVTGLVESDGIPQPVRSAALCARASPVRYHSVVTTP